jgi:hypothetical protein
MDVRPTLMLVHAKDSVQFFNNAIYLAIHALAGVARLTLKASFSLKNPKSNKPIVEIPKKRKGRSSRLDRLIDEGIDNPEKFINKEKEVTKKRKDDAVTLRENIDEVKNYSENKK